MKFEKLLLILLPLIFSTLTSCSSDSENPAPTPDKPEVINPDNQKLVSITYPRSQEIQYVKDPVTYEYDNQKRVNKFAYTGWVYGVTYVNDNLIEVDMLDDPIAGKKQHSKKSLHLKDGNLVLITTKSYDILESNNEVDYTSQDSTLYKYTNNYLTKIETYDRNTYQSTYRLSKEIEFKIQNGNVIQINENGYVKRTLNYAYDTTAFVNLGDMAYETPISFSVSSGLDILLKDKLGKKTTNNVIKIDYVYDEGYFPYPNSYSSITFQRNVDNFGRISEILISGSVFYNKGSEIKNFNNLKTSFTYK